MAERLIGARSVPPFEIRAHRNTIIIITTMFLRLSRQPLHLLAQRGLGLRLSSTYTLITPSTPRPRVALVELNRPKALNALSSPLMAELNSHLQSLDNDMEIGAIVLTGGEKVFAGIPLLQLSYGVDCSWCGYQRVRSCWLTRDNGRMKDKQYHEVVGEKFIASWQDLTKITKPIIAAVNGYAVPSSSPTSVPPLFLWSHDFHCSG